jgi:hypothetical protein
MGHKNKKALKEGLEFLANNDQRLFPASPINLHGFTSPVKKQKCYG